MIDNTEQRFGGIWTMVKLDAIEEYLKAYSNVMKNQNFRLCYIDTFAGSGVVICH